MLGEYKLVLGLEIHMHVKTAQKMFCGCNADFYGAPANTHTCPTCLGLPGALPVPNFEAVKKTQLLGLAFGCKLSKHSRFDRKHYFYPDLPKGYQISQYKNPLCIGGDLALSSGNIAKLERIHLEEDTAKSFHEGARTLIDFNKSGVPLIELVTKPCFTSVEDAVEFSKKVWDVVRLLGVSDADMEKGQLRIEPNISLRTQKMEKEDRLPDYKVEVKNINSFRFMEKAVKAEILRQRKMLDAGESIPQENRGYDESTKTTVSQRSKEEAHDYRYFPEPDIPPMEFDEKHFKALQEQLPKLPWEVEARLVKDYGLSERVAASFVSGATIALINTFEKVVDKGVPAKKAANLLLNNLTFRNLSVEDFVAKVRASEEVMGDSKQLGKIVKEVLSDNPGAVEKYKSGNEAVLQFLIGQVMRETRGKADPSVVEKLIIGA